MSDYGRFDRYGLPASYDQWRLSPPPEYEYDDDEEEDEPVPVMGTCLYRTDAEGELTEDVYLFCSSECMEHWENDHGLEGTVPFPTPLASVLSGAVCQWCAIELEVPS